MMLENESAACGSPAGRPLGASGSQARTDSLLQHLFSLVASIGSTHDTSCLVQGPAGIGKTWLLRQLRAQIGEHLKSPPTLLLERTGGRAGTARSAERIVAPRLAETHELVAPGQRGPGASANRGLRLTANSLKVVFGHGETTPGTPALWPFIEVVRALERSAPGTTRSRELTHALWPWLPPEMQQGRESPEGRRAATRKFLLSDGLVQLILDAATRSPLCVIFEDLHDFDQASLALLARLLREAQAVPLLIIGSIRRQNQAAQGDAALERAARAFASTLLVPGLALDEVRTLLSSALGGHVAEGLASHVCERTGGNPLYVLGVAAMLAANSHDSQRELAAVQLNWPADLLVAVAQQVDSLSTACREILRVAAVLGREFDVDLLRRVCLRADADGLEAELESARRCGALERCGTSSRHRFAHELLSDALAAELDARRRSAAHLRAARVLVASRVAPLDAATTSRAARHFLESHTPIGFRRAAALYDTLARAAFERAAHAETTEALALALTARRGLTSGQSRTHMVSTRREVGLALLELARSTWRCGDHAQARLICSEAMDQGRRRHAPELGAPPHPQHQDRQLLQLRAGG